MQKVIVFIFISFIFWDSIKVLLLFVPAPRIFKKSFSGKDRILVSENKITEVKNFVKKIYDPRK